jgi:hypothetical protein
MALHKFYLVLFVACLECLAAARPLGTARDHSSSRSRCALALANNTPSTKTNVRITAEAMFTNSAETCGRAVTAGRGPVPSASL